jgi:hypothetical protein
VTLRTRLIRLGDKVLYERRGRALSWSVQGNTAQTLLNQHVGLVEHYEAGGDGIELSWVLSQRPVAQGPLEIELEMKEMSCAGISDQWIHLADATGTPRVRIGRAVAVDSAGRRFEAVMVANHQSLCVRVSPEDLAQAVYPLAVDPLISPEFGMDEPVMIPRAGEHQIPQVAWNGTNWLVVWTEWNAIFDSPVEVVAARVSKDGVVLDPFGILISGGEAPPAAPAVTSNGKDYFVVWEHFDFATALDIRGARVTADGQVSDPGGIVINKLPNDQWNPSVAAESEGYLVVWKDRRTGGDADIYGTRVSNEGVVLDGDGFPINIAPEEQSHPSVARGPGGFLVVWSDWRNISSNGADIFGARLDTNGTVLDPGGIAISTAPGDQVFPRAAANSNGYMVVWHDFRNSTADTPQTDIYGTLVTPAGEVSHPQGIAVSTAPGYQTFPGVAARAENSENFLVVWNDNRPVQPGIYSARVSGAGVVLDPEGILVDSTPITFTPAIAASDKEFLVVWNRTSRPEGGFGSAVVGARLNDQAKSIDSKPILITAGDSGEASPAVASNGTNWLVVWQDSRNVGAIGIYGARISYNGTPLDTTALPISTQPGGVKLSPVVASAAGNYLVAWADSRNSPPPFYDIYGARIRGDGTLMDPAGIAICTAHTQFTPAVASDGTNYLVVWQDAREVNASDIYAARLRQDGNVLEPNGFPVSADTNGQYEPDVAFDGVDFLVVWSQFAHGTPPGYQDDIYGARVSRGGVVLDPAGIPISRAAYAQSLPAVASDGSGFFVTWRDTRNTTTEAGDTFGGQVYGARVSSAGDVLDPDGLPVSTNAFLAAPSLAFSGDSYLAVWDSHPVPGVSGPTQIRAAWIGRDGSVLLNDLVVNPIAGADAAVTGGPCGSFIVVNDATRNGASRVVGNLVSFGNAPVIRSLRLGDGTATIVWQAEAGKTYRLQFKPGLSDSNWLNLDPVVTATNSTASLLDSTIGQEAQRFYRVLQLP